MVVLALLVGLFLTSVNAVGAQSAPAASAQDQGDQGDDGDGPGDDSSPAEQFFGSIWDWITGQRPDGAGGGAEEDGSPDALTPSDCHPSPDARPGVVDVSSFGARPDDTADSGPAVQCALDSLVPGQTLVFGPGEYRHAKVLRVGVADVRITGRGAVLTATDERAAAFKTDADRVAVDSLTFGVASVSRRIPGRERSGVWVAGHDGVSLTDVTVTGAAAGGVVVSDQASTFRLVRVTVRGTRADGIHMTDGVTGGLVDHASVSGTGDDGIAVVSYKKDPVPVTNIIVSSPRVSAQERGRGLSVVGGENISLSGVDVESSPSAAIYIAVEGDPWNTRDVRNVTVRGGRLVGSNTKSTVNHGAVLVLLGTPDARIDQVDVADLEIEGTRPSASSSVTVKSAEGQQPQGLQFDGLRIVGGPGRQFGGNVPGSAYRVSG